MAKQNNLTPQIILEEFLINTPEPTARDWKVLISNHPEHANYLIDAHIIHENLGSDLDGYGSVNLVSSASASRTMTRAMEMLLGTSDEDGQLIQRQLNDLVGPRAREAAAAVGLKENVSLFNGIVAGRILAPVAILHRLAERFQTSASELALAFARRFESSGAPAFKSLSQKPTNELRPMPWEAAVRSEQLSKADEQELLALMDRDDAI